MPKTVNPFARKREAPSPLKGLRRSSSTKVNRSRPSTAEEKLDDAGLIPSLAPPGVEQDVNTVVRYIHAHMWTDMPETAAGMGSERIGELLRFRRALPRIVSIAHVHAMSISSTETERELARLIARGAVRKVTVLGRGKGGAAVGEGIVLAEDWKTSVRENNSLDDELKDKYLALLDAHPSTTLTPTTDLSSDQVRDLVQAGYLISPSALVSTTAPTAPSSSSTFAPLSHSGYHAATGTLAAVGGNSAIHASGGGGSTLATSSNRSAPGPSSHFHHNMRSMTFALPSTGAYLKLLTSVRIHLLSLLKQLSPKFKEATMEMLREKWDGNVPNDAASAAKRARGDWTGVLPGRTRKWREFCGVRFEWVLGECVGAGLVEVFETGSVGLGVRART